MTGSCTRRVQATRRFDAWKIACLSKKPRRSVRGLIVRIIFALRKTDQTLNDVIFARSSNCHGRNHASLNFWGFFHIKFTSGARAVTQNRSIQKSCRFPHRPSVTGVSLILVRQITIRQRASRHPPAFCGHLPSQRNSNCCLTGWLQACQARRWFAQTPTLILRSSLPEQCRACHYR